MVAEANFTLGENPRVHPAPSGMQLLRDSSELSIDERPFDRFAGAGERGDLEEDFVAQSDTRPGNDQIPVDSLHRHVLARRSDVDRVAFLLEGVNPLQRINANRPFGSTVVRFVVLRVS